MSGVAQLQLFEFIALLVASHYGLKIIAPKLDIPFLGIGLTTCINAFLFAFCPSNKLVWSFVALATLGCSIYFFLIYKKNIKNVKGEKKPLSLSMIAWPIAIFVTAFLLASTLFLSPGRSQPNSEVITTRDKLMSQLFQGEDNFTHMNILQTINKTGESTYFSSTTKWNDHLIPQVSAYAQLPHSASSTLKVGIHDFLEISGRSNSDITTALWAYVLSHFFFMGCAIGLGAAIVVDILRRYSKMNDFLAFFMATAFTVFAIKALTFPIVDYGFFSQSAGMMGLLILFLIETSTAFSSYKESKRWQAALIRIVPIIIIGQTWWVLAPIGAAFIATRLIPEYWSAKKTKNVKATLLPTFILIAGGLFSLLPAYVQLFVYDFDALDIANIPGGIQSIDIVRIIIYTGVVATIALASLIVFRNSHRTIQWSTFYFIISAFGALTALAVYQKRSAHQFTYYSYKLAWSVAWIPFIALFVFSGFALFFLGKVAIRLSKGKITILYPFAVSAVAGVCIYLLVGAAATHSLKLSRIPNPVQLADLARGIEKAESEDRILIAVSDCGGVSDYFFQKAASTIQARWTRETFFFAVAEITVIDKDKIRRDLLEANPELYRVIDLTPTADENAPSDRLHIAGIPTERTQLEKPWETERFASLCVPETINSIPAENK